MSARNNPFEMIERMFDQMSRQFEVAARAWGTGGRNTGSPGHSTMEIDLVDHGDEFVVTADVPGFEKDEISPRIIGTTLHITGTHEEATEREEETYIRSERTRRSLREEVQLPEPIQKNEIEATLNNGVLTIRLPKADPTEEGGHRIDIE